MIFLLFFVPAAVCFAVYEIRLRRLQREAMEREADPEPKAALISAYREADHGNFDP